MFLVIVLCTLQRHSTCLLSLAEWEWQFSQSASGRTALPHVKSGVNRAPATRHSAANDARASCCPGPFKASTGATAVKPRADLLWFSHIYAVSGHCHYT